MNKKLNHKVLNYYEKSPEGSRLESSMGQLEFERSKEIIARYISPPPARVLDVGGGTGLYSRWLTQLGYETHLIDPVENLVEEAKKISTQEPHRRIASFTVGDARKIDFDDGFANSVLLFGSLYHLTDKSDRMQALHEAVRVLKTGGILFSVGIYRIASALDGVRYGFLKDTDFEPIIEQDLETGQHRNPTEDLSYFTDAYFHLPSELEEEIAEAGFEILAILPVEGVGAFTSNLDDIWNCAEGKKSLLDIIRRTEWIPSILGATSHFICVAKKAM